MRTTQDSPALPWTVVILLTKDSTVTLSEDALLLNGSSETRPVVFLDLQLSPGEKEYPVPGHSPPKKKQVMIQLRGTAIAVTVRGTQQNNQTQAAHAEYKVRFQPITDANVLQLHVATDVETNQIDFLDS